MPIINLEEHWVSYMSIGVISEHFKNALSWMDIKMIKAKQNQNDNTPCIKHIWHLSSFVSQYQFLYVKTRDELWFYQISCKYLKSKIKCLDCVLVLVQFGVPLKTIATGNLVSCKLVLLWKELLDFQLY